ncbi:MAG: BT4734/BF3469 family protein [bacterium]|nr:BT4734/BF3469 family protein [bacterium]
MFRFSFTENVAGKTIEVNRQLFHEIWKRESVRQCCARIAEQVKLLEQTTDEQTRKAIQNRIGQLKRTLPAFCWHAWFESGVRKNEKAHPSGLVMIDVDHVKQPELMYAKLESQALSLGMLAAHITPSTHGLRLVFPLPAGMDLMEAQSHYAEALALQVDACTKDLARLSFCVPESYWLYVDEDQLFDGEEVTPMVAQIGQSASSAQSSQLPVPVSQSVQLGRPKQSNQLVELSQPIGMELHPVELDLSIQPAQSSQPVEVQSTLPKVFTLEASPEAETATTFDPDYDGVPYPLLVNTLCELMGGVPAHGSRNNFIFTMAAHLRYVCNDDPNWIAQVLPTYGEAEPKWRRTIESACNRSQNRAMPSIVARAIEQARKRLRMDQVLDSNRGEELPPAMPTQLPPLVAHLVKNVPEVCRPAVANAVFPALAIHLKGVKFWLIDGTEKEATFMCVTMARQSSGKASVNKPIEYIVADIVEQDEQNRLREQQWKDVMSQKGANKEKPKRPDDLCVQVLVSDMTNAAFVQRMKDANGRYLYTNLEELELLKQLQTNGSRDIGKIICLCFDNGMYGQERVGTQSVTARVNLRWNWNASSTIQKGIQFFKGRMVDGTLSRLNFCTIIPDKSKPFVYGRYDEQYAEELKPYVTNLNLAEGNVECPEALELAQSLLNRCLDEGALSDDDIYQDLAYRAVTIAYLKAMVLYIAHNYTWTPEIASFMEWSLFYDLWCKQHFFGEQVELEKRKERVGHPRGRQNLLALLPDSFTMQDAKSVRLRMGLEEDPRQMLATWAWRGYIRQDPSQSHYVKTEKFLLRG